MPEITSVEQSRDVLTQLFNKLQQAQWRVAKLEKQLYGPSSERKARTRATFLKYRYSFQSFPQHPTPQSLRKSLVPATPEQELRPRRQFAIKSLETVMQRLEPEEKV